MALTSTKFLFLLLSLKYFGCCVNLSFHRLTRGKVRIGIYCYFTADILIKVLQKCSLFSPLPNVSFWSEHLNLIGCQINQKVKFTKKNILKNLIRSCKGDKLCRIAYSTSLYKNFQIYYHILGYFI